MLKKYGWRFNIADHENEVMLFGGSINFNKEWGEDEKEFIVSIHLFKFTIEFGKFHWLEDEK